MRLSTASLLSVVVAPFAVSAAPFRRSTDNGTLNFLRELQFRRWIVFATIDTILSLEYANVIEQLESSFYSAVLAQFNDSDYTDAGFFSATIPIQELTAIQSDEAAHVTALQVRINFRSYFFFAPLSDSCVPSHCRR